MKWTFRLIAAFLLTGTAYAAAPDANQSKVQESLTSQGYLSWKRIELDKDVWEVDDAVDASGKRFDLRVDAKSLKVISKEVNKVP